MRAVLSWHSGQMALADRAIDAALAAMFEPLARKPISVIFGAAGVFAWKAGMIGCFKWRTRRTIFRKCCWSWKAKVRWCGKDKETRFGAGNGGVGAGGLPPPN